MWMTWDQICPKVEEREVVPKIIPQTGNSSHHEISRLCFISNFNWQSIYQKQPMGIFKKRRAHLVREIKNKRHLACAGNVLQVYCVWSGWRELKRQSTKPGWTLNPGVVLQKQILWEGEWKDCLHHYCF